MVITCVNPEKNQSFLHIGAMTVNMNYNLLDHLYLYQQDLLDYIQITTWLNKYGECIIVINN